MNTSDRFLRFAAECEVMAKFSLFSGEQGGVEWFSPTMAALCRVVGTPIFE
jgi:hypothetical protein